MLKRILAICLLNLSAGVYAEPSPFYVAPTLAYVNTYVGDERNESINPQFTIGVGQKFQDYLYLNVEAFGVVKSISHNNSQNNNSSLRTTYSYGASFLPALALDNILNLFMRLGIVNTNFDAYDEDKIGMQVGLGLEGVLNANWHMRGEYIFTRYQRIATLGTPKAGAYALSAVYHF